MSRVTSVAVTNPPMMTTAKGRDVSAPTAEREMNLLPVAPRLFQPAVDRLDEVVVEAAAESLVGRDDDEQNVFDLRADGEQRMRRRLDARREPADQLLEFLRINERLALRVHRLVQAARRDHFHGLGDFSRVVQTRELGFVFF